MTNIETISLQALTGEHLLDGVDFAVSRVHMYGDHFEDANAIRVRLDGKVYTAVENPDDGYRSSMGNLYVEECAMENTFPPIRVLAIMKYTNTYGASEIIQLIDTATGKIVVEFGTDNIDDYYPSFVSAFWPEHMTINKQE